MSSRTNSVDPDRKETLDRDSSVNSSVNSSIGTGGESRNFRRHAIASYTYTLTAFIAIQKEQKELMLEHGIHEDDIHS